MTGFATLVADVAEDINRGTSFNTRIKKALANAIKFYRARRYGFNQKTKIFISNTEFTSLTANWLEFDSLYIDTTAGILVLEETNWGVLHEGSNGRPAGFTKKPTRYAVQNRLLRCDSPPDITYSFHMSYLYDLQEISISSSDSASNAWTNEGYELIKTHAMVDVLENFIAADEELQKVAILRNREAQVEKELKRRANQEQGSGKITPWM